MKALIYLADGFEEIEALATCDVLRRGGVETILVKVECDAAAGGSCGSHSPEHKCMCVVGAHGIKVKCALSLAGNAESGVFPESAEDIMIFPGGLPGAGNLAECRPLVDAMTEHYGRGGRLAAICAAPGLVLGQLEVPAGTVFTCYEGFQQALQARGGIYSPVAAVTSNRITTGRGPAYAVDFGLEILRELEGADAAESVRAGMFLD